MSNFPKLIPAFTANIVIDAPIIVGAVSKGAPLSVVRFLTDKTNNYIKSEPDYPIKLDAVFLHGNDFANPSGKHIRLEVNSVLKDKSGAIIAFKYSGIVNVTSGIAAVLDGDTNAKTTPFGNAFTHVLFETGSEDLKGIERKVYVASGRFVLEEGKPVAVEYKISEVAA
ncbi:hypothetical protein BKA65DRAFT_554284 [Rhexocercosporidium sp. MPI-PUGE-AT-0058]|nr:hypothetical protein BKA65DRAFT_554284 [Rhexocercosporidium sp. MPI-PUGE-AT-0058]